MNNSCHNLPAGKCRAVIGSTKESRAVEMRGLEVGELEGHSSHEEGHTGASLRPYQTPTRRLAGENLREISDPILC